MKLHNALDSTLKYTKTYRQMVLIYWVEEEEKKKRVKGGGTRKCNAVQED